MNVTERVNQQLDKLAIEVQRRLNMNQKYLVKYEADYADEFDVYGLAILTEKDKQYFDNFNSFPITKYFGTNEEIEYENKEELLKDYTWTAITDEEAELISRLVGYDYGHFFYPESDDEDLDYDLDV